MNKFEIKRFLESEKEKTINNIKEIKKEEERKEHEKIATEALIGLSYLDNELSIMLSNLNSIKTYFEKNKEYKFDYSATYNLIYYLKTTVNKGIFKDISENLEPKYNVRTKPSIKFNEQREAVREEYSKLIGNVSTMTGTQATEYLKELGFAIPEKNTIKNEIMAPVNISLLKELRGGK